MEDRIKLKVIGLSYSQLQSGAFALLLGQEKGPVRIPVVIGASEAHSIAIYMEGVTPPRPMTHDLFSSFTQAFGIRLREVFIYKFDDGVFYSELTFQDAERQIVLDARTSDAIAIAMRAHAPIYTTRAILEQTGFVIENDPTVEAEEDSSDTAHDELPQHENIEDIPLEKLALEELEKMLAKAIDSEDYEEAARISQVIKQKQSTDQ